MKIDPEILWDVAVIGGGPAGMMAAGRAAERGARVILIEKNDSLGKKLLITGGGRCNVTNAEFDTRTLLSKFKDSDKFLFSAFSQWSVHNTISFFHGRNMPTKIEANQRVFPVSDKAQSVWDVLVEYLKRGSVTVLSRSPVTGFIKNADGTLGGVALMNKQIVRAKSIIIATGGKSRPETGSTGEGFEWLRSIGHTIADSGAALVPLKIHEPWISRLAGLSLPRVKITMLQNEVQQTVANGKILFTHVGVSGPTILNMSRDVGELLKYGEVTLSLDLLPGLDYAALNLRLQEIFKENDKKKFKNCLTGLAPSSLAPVVVELSGIDPDKQCNSVTRDERLALVKLFKHFRMSVAGLLGLEKAIITSGGVVLQEIDFKTMASRRHPNLYIVGDVLNIDRPSGGYSLQLCWTTGFVAGNSVPL